jgi:hypothetical protein
MSQKIGIVSWAFEPQLTAVTAVTVMTDSDSNNIKVRGLEGCLSGGMSHDGGCLSASSTARQASC